MSENHLSKQPVPDRAEDNAYFPSEYSLSLYTAPKTNFEGVEHKDAYTEGKWKVLVIASDERYLMLQNGKMFSTGNHPVETLLPLHHMMEAGFDLDVATLSGNPVKLEHWAMPTEDEAVMETYEQLKAKLKAPKKLSDVVAHELGADADYLSVFIPGGHAALIGLPESEDVQQTLDWALTNNRFIITLCHGPAALLAGSLNRQTSTFAGYEVCVFPDALDEGANVDIGYLPGKLQWLVAESLTQDELHVVNQEMTGQVHKDRQLLTGDSPLASDALGKLAVNEMLAHIQ
ncbi:protein deglycase HchA [Staphylococcus muscae]|uniref:Chaperone protein hchA n=1 Tax=Staphylococcus muscae TaxID=1294 RepID=A0A240C6I4_9STAP|nr:glyoxalase III HchA [Staphylococcus muscae]AVQ33588.1 protein deglycase HchA [Staphylococcus muscae]PNZ04869.1 protein deglycase HchA [Staphylococcus muscae]GGA86071.1 protein deglycase HchA [Staphylococcus muscae]SNW03584.1 Chaperone protein hchA [Staphylococcus muscae]